MTTIYEFTSNLASKNANTITDFFDEIMVLYNLVGSRRDLDICQSGENASFILTMESDNDAKVLYEKLDDTSFTVYGEAYYIYMAPHDNNSVLTIISKIPNESH